MILGDASDHDLLCRYAWLGFGDEGKLGIPRYLSNLNMSDVDQDLDTGEELVTVLNHYKI